MVGLLAFSSSLSLFLGGFFWAWRRELAVEQRVRDIVGAASGRPGLDWKEVRDQAVRRLLALVERFAPADYLRRTETFLRKAGIRGPLAVRVWLLVRSGLVLGGFFAGLALAALVPHGGGIAAVLAGPALGWVVPRAYVQRAVARQQSAARRALPNALDMLTISVEAGLGFDQALARTSRNLGGLLGMELRQVLAEMSLGKTRREALRDAANRLGLEEFGSFASAVIQADRLGMGIAAVLRVQSEEVRVRLRQKAEEQAMKAPIKILFPLVMFIFPGLFVIILGPAVIHIMRVLG